jgi:hypothetical protein
MRGPKIERGLFKRLPKGAAAGIVGGALTTTFFSIWRAGERGVDAFGVLLVLPLALIGVGALAWLVVLCTYRIQSPPLRFLFALSISVALAVGASLGLVLLLT